MSAATFDVVATRRDASAARPVVLPFYIAMQAGTQVVAKRVGQVAVNFAAGSQRGRGLARRRSRIDRASTGLPEDVRREADPQAQDRRRRRGDRPAVRPRVRDAVARATFEHLVGFQLTQDQLHYNATR